MADEDECDVAVAATDVDDAVDEDDENFGFLWGGSTRGSSWRF